jgi:hypothetical protein
MVARRGKASFITFLARWHSTKAALMPAALTHAPAAACAKTSQSEVEELVVAVQVIASSK